MNRRYSGHPLMTPLMIIVLVVFLLLAFLYLNLAEHVFRLLGLSPLGAFLVLGGSLLGSMINIPLTRKRIKLIDPRVEQMPAWMRWMPPIFHYYPPAVVDQVVAVNVGGALVPGNHRPHEQRSYLGLLQWRRTPSAQIYGQHRRGGNI